MTESTTVKVAALLWYILQCSVHNLLLRYSRARDVKDMFFPSVAVFFTETVKVVFCFMMICIESGGVVKLIKERIIDKPNDTLKVCIPAMLYTVQNNLSYIAATHLEAAPYAIFAAVIFSILIFKRYPIWVQWFSFIILFAGVSLVQLQSTGSAQASNIAQNPVYGFCIACVACTISGFAGIFLEKILKGSSPVSIWMRNIQMAVFAIPASFTAAMIQDTNAIIERGFLFGFDSVVWITILWYGIGGLAAAVCIKYVGTIEKDFATGFAIILSTIGSVYVFGFDPNLTFIYGAILVIFSIFLFSASDTLTKLFANVIAKISCFGEKVCKIKAISFCYC